MEVQGAEQTDVVHAGGSSFMVTPSFSDMSVDWASTGGTIKVGIVATLVGMLDDTPRGLFTSQPH